MKKKILAGLASFTLATALVIAPSIVGGGSSANAAEKVASGTNVSSFTVTLGNKSCKVKSIGVWDALNVDCNDMQHFLGKNGKFTYGNYVTKKNVRSIQPVCKTGDDKLNHGANAILRS
jgi:hypothetical protein